MELRAKVIYHSRFGTLNPGETTEGLNYTGAKKLQMLSDFPDWFEVVGADETTVILPSEPDENTEPVVPAAKKQRGRS